MTTLPPVAGPVKFQGLHVSYSAPEYSREGSLTVRLTDDDRVTFQNWKGKDSEVQDLTDDPSLRPSFVRETKNLAREMDANEKRNQDLTEGLKKLKSDLLASVDGALEGLGLRARTDIADEAIQVLSARVNQEKLEDQAFFAQHVQPELAVLLANLPLDGTTQKDLQKALQEKEVYLQKAKADEHRGAGYQATVYLGKSNY